MHIYSPFILWPLVTLGFIVLHLWPLVNIFLNFFLLYCFSVLQFITFKIIFLGCRVRALCPPVLQGSYPQSNIYSIHFVRARADTRPRPYSIKILLHLYSLMSKTSLINILTNRSKYVIMWIGGNEIWRKTRKIDY